MVLSKRYFARLNIDEAQASELMKHGPTVKALEQLQEAHLAKIPFENLAQHGATLPNSSCTDEAKLPKLDLELTAYKILDNQRGGFCYEVNLLFAAFLEELGYKVVRLPAFVHAKEDFMPIALHVLLVVTCKDEEVGKDALVRLADVGFGEPPIHPLNFNLLEEEQITPDGMRSKLVKEDDGSMVLLWYINGTWMKRLKWNPSTHPPAGLKMEDFSEGLQKVLHPESKFSLKLITTRLTRTEKVTLAGSKLKITGPPRFPEDGLTGEQVPVKLQHLGSDDEARKILQNKFGMPLTSTEGLSLTKSLRAHEEMWSEQ